MKEKREYAQNIITKTKDVRLVNNLSMKLQMKLVQERERKKQLKIKQEEIRKKKAMESYKKELEFNKKRQKYLYNSRKPDMLS